jgi:hypothetical protein
MRFHPQPAWYPPGPASAWAYARYVPQVPSLHHPHQTWYPPTFTYPPPSSIAVPPPPASSASRSTSSSSSRSASEVADMRDKSSDSSSSGGEPEDEGDASDGSNPEARFRREKLQRIKDDAHLEAWRRKKRVLPQTSLRRVEVILQRRDREPTQAHETTNDGDAAPRSSNDSRHFQAPQPMAAVLRSKSRSPLQRIIRKRSDSQREQSRDRHGERNRSESRRRCRADGGGYRSSQENHRHGGTRRSPSRRR